MRSVLAVSVIACLGASTASLGCRSRDRKSRPDPEPTPVTQDHRPTIRLNKLTPERKVTHFQTPPELPRHVALVLEKPGKKPRRRLRYKLDDQPREFTVTVKASAREFSRTWSEPIELPELRYGLGLMVRSGEAAPDGKPGEAAPDDKPDEAAPMLQLRGLSAKVADARPESDARRAEAVDQFLAQYRSHVERRRASTTVDEQGLIGRMALTPDAEVSPEAGQIRDAMAQLLLESMVRLPDVPVGVGARWNVETLMRKNRGVVKQVAHYKIASVSRQRIELEAEITQTGERQNLDTPELPADQVAELIALLWRARGTLELDLSVPTPISGAMNTELRFHGRMVSRGGHQDHVLESTAQVTLHTAAPAPTKK